MIAYVEGPLCYYHAALIWARRPRLGRPQPAASGRSGALLGLLAGGAMACKYPALISAVIPFGLLALVDCLAAIARPARVLAYVAGLGDRDGPLARART